MEELRPADRAKLAAAARALEAVKPGMVIGLGTGSTAGWFVRLLGRRVRSGLDVRGVPTSEATARLAQAEGIALTTLDNDPALDLTVDGADEIDPALRLIKGGGGALLREKIVAAASSRMIVIADDAKLVARLGRFPLPVEVVRFGLGATRAAIGRALVEAGHASAVPVLRMDGDQPFLTDQGNLILDLPLTLIDDGPALHQALLRIPGVVETGLFIGLADQAIIGTASGQVECLVRPGFPAPQPGVHIVDIEALIATLGR